MPTKSSNPPTAILCGILRKDRSWKVRKHNKHKIVVGAVKIKHEQKREL